MRCTQLAENTGRKSRQKSPSGHHCTTLSGYIFASKAVSTIGEKLLSSNMFSRCPHNMVNFGQLAAEIGLPVWGTPANFNGFRLLASLCTSVNCERQPNFATFNRGRHGHLCSAGRPSRWALAHILVMAALWNWAGHYILPYDFYLLSSFFPSPNLSGRRLDAYHTSTHGVALVRI